MPVGSLAVRYLTLSVLVFGAAPALAQPADAPSNRGRLTLGLAAVVGPTYDDDGNSRVRGQFARSPIVCDAGRPDQLFGFAGLAYSF
jgi:outer membrane scaffolding protein for murein synthesis (MipA/OmpV family)